jgi:hypothetical protein
MCDVLVRCKFEASPSIMLKLLMHNEMLNEEELLLRGINRGGDSESGCICLFG